MKPRKRSVKSRKKSGGLALSFLNAAAKLTAKQIALVVFTVAFLGVLTLLIGGNYSKKIAELNAGAAFLDYAFSNTPTQSLTTGVETTTAVTATQEQADVCSPNQQVIEISQAANFSTSVPVPDISGVDIQWNVYPDPSDPAYPDLASRSMTGGNFSVTFKTLGKANVVATWNYLPAGESVSETCTVRVVDNLKTDPRMPVLNFILKGKVTNELFVRKYDPITFAWSAANVEKCNIRMEELGISLSSSQNPDATPLGRFFSFSPDNISILTALGSLQRSLTITGSCTGPYGTAYQQARVRLLDYLCGPYTQNAQVGQVVAFNNGDVGKDTISWSAPEGDTKTGFGTTFSTKFSTVGRKTVYASLSDKVNDPVNFPPYKCYVEVKAASLQSDPVVDQVQGTTDTRNSSYPSRYDSGGSTSSSSGWGFTRALRSLFGF